MSIIRTCADGGCLVGGRGRIPRDPAEYQHPTVAARIGCNHLVYRICRARVRHGPPGWVARDDARRHIAAIYQARSWADLPQLEKTYQHYRLYLCRCRAWSENHVTYMAEDDPDLTQGLPWGCGGHAAPRLPLRLGPHEIGADTDWEGLVTNLLAGWRPRDLAVDRGDGPALWMCWLRAYLDGLPEAEAFSRAAATHFDGADPLSRGRILYFFSRFPHAAGCEMLLDRAGTEVSQTARGYPIPEAERAPTLLHLAAARLTRWPPRAGHGPPSADEADRQAAEVLRQVLLMPLSQLRHDDLGPHDPVASYEAHVRRGVAHFGRSERRLVTAFAASWRAARRDVPGQLLRSDDVGRALGPEDRLWLARHVCEVERANTGRWRDVLDLFQRRTPRDAPDVGTCLVAAAGSLLSERLVSPAELRAWATQTKDRQRDPRVLPLVALIDGHAPGGEET